MNRTQKKCFFAATGFHLLLIGILLFGPGFLSSRDKTEDLQVITFEPMILTDKQFSGGGNPNAKPPPAANPPAPPVQQQQQVVPPAPNPPQQPTRVEKTEQVKEIKTTKTDSDALETKAETKRSKPQVSKTLIKRNQSTSAKTPPSTSKTTSQTPDNRSKEFSKAAQRIREGATSSTEIEPFGPGGGGPTYANYAAWVKTVYTEAWIAPMGVEDDDATAKVSVTIARDGTVISARIIGTSGNAAVDRSVQSTLDRVTTIGKPFPEGAKESERTYKINFNLKAKQLLG